MGVPSMAARRPSIRRAAATGSNSVRTKGGWRRLGLVPVLLYTSISGRTAPLSPLVWSSGFWCMCIPALLRAGAAWPGNCGSRRTIDEVPGHRRAVRQPCVMTYETGPGMLIHIPSVFARTPSACDAQRTKQPLPSGMGVPCPDCYWLQPQLTRAFTGLCWRMTRTERPVPVSEGPAFCTYSGRHGRRCYPQCSTISSTRLRSRSSSLCSASIAWSW